MRAKSMEGAVVKADDLISLTDLLFRWPYEPIYKIMKAIKDKSLHLFQIESSSNTISKEKEIHISFFYERLMPELFSYCSARFNRLTFFKKDVDAIEKKYTNYPTISDNPNIGHKFDLCTIKNIHQLAPQALHVFLGYPDNVFINRKKIDAMLDSDIACSPYAIFYLREAKKSEWCIPHEKLWPKFQLPNFALLTENSMNENDFESIKKFIHDKRAKGLTNHYTLLALISEYVDFLTNEKLGALIPANPNTNIAGNSAAKQGARLRKKFLNLDVKKILESSQ